MRKDRRGAISVIRGRRCTGQAEGRTDGRPENRTVSTSAFVDSFLSRAVSRKNSWHILRLLHRTFVAMLLASGISNARFAPPRSMVLCYTMLWIRLHLLGDYPTLAAGAARLCGELLGRDRVPVIYIKNQAAVMIHSDRIQVDKHTHTHTHTHTQARFSAATAGAATYAPRNSRLSVTSSFQAMPPPSGPSWPTRSTGPHRTSAGAAAGSGSHATTCFLGARPGGARAR